MQALKENRTISVRFTVDAAGDDILFFDTINPDVSPVVYTPDFGEYIFNITNYGSGVGYGTGAAIKNWNIEDITGALPANPVLSFSNLGTAGTGTVYLDNENNDDCYAITVINSGSIKIRRFSSAGWN